VALAALLGAGERTEEALKSFLAVLGASPQPDNWLWPVAVTGVAMTHTGVPQSTAIKVVQRLAQRSDDSRLDGRVAVLDGKYVYIPIGFEHGELVDVRNAAPVDSAAANEALVTVLFSLRVAEHLCRMVV
jgi:hypothetical protein